ncbi:MAG: nodulation protein NfeD [Candidatus Bathyarchaeota archaeon]
MNKQKLLITLIIVFLFSIPSCLGEPVQVDRYLLIRLEGVISASAAEMVAEGIRGAEETGEAVILLLDTPGGSMDATFRIVEAIERAETPVLGYVYPKGGRAWSAGTYILMATRVAAMAPNTIIGSCQPVAYDPLGGSKPINDSKQINALTKYLAERARANKRNVSVAERFVSENLNLNEAEALEQGVIEYVAADVAALLGQLDGVTVEAGGRTVTLRGTGASVKELSLSIRVSFLGFLADPTLAYLLFIVGFYGLILGLYSPGLGAEAVGGLMLVLGLVGLGVFGVNLGGMILLAAGIVLLVAETQIPGFGAVGATGVACMLLGSFLVFPADWMVQEAWLNSLYTLLIVVPLITGGFFAFAIYKVLEARRRAPYMVGAVGGVAEAAGDMDAGGGGFVLMEGETWMARSRAPVRRGERVRVVAKEGPVLVVEPYDDPASRA